MTTHSTPLRVVLISTYDLGRQPFGLASPAAWLRAAGAQVTCFDLAVEPLDPDAVAGADLVAFHLPMHTAARIAARAAGRIRELNPSTHLCFYGLYAPVNEPYLRALGAETILGGEYESGLLSLVERIGAGSRRAGAGSRSQPEPVISLARQRFLCPDRSGLPPLARYARLVSSDGAERRVGYTEASRGCKHLCRHCPVVPVYRGHFRVVQPEVVLEDVRRQVEAGAEHVTFGDPDFFNGIGHALPLVRALHREHPRLTFDVTIKIEHLLQHARHLPLLRDSGCLFVTTAVESIDDRVLAILDKGHTRDDFLRVLRLFREVDLVLNPTFIPFTPWITLEGYEELLETLQRLDLVEQVAPIQLSIRLLIPAGSRLLELAETCLRVEPFDERALVHPWRHEDFRIDLLQQRVQTVVQRGEAQGESRRQIFDRIRALVETPAFDGPVDSQGTETIPQDFQGRRRVEAAIAAPDAAITDHGRAVITASGEGAIREGKPASTGYEAPAIAPVHVGSASEGTRLLRGRANASVREGAATAETVLAESRRHLAAPRVSRASIPYLTEPWYC